MIVSLDDDATDNPDLALGQTHHLLGEAGDALAQRLVHAATLTLRRDGGFFRPIPGDNLTADTYEAVLEVEPPLIPEFTSDVVEGGHSTEARSDRRSSASPRAAAVRSPSAKAVAALSMPLLALAKSIKMRHAPQ